MVVPFYVCKVFSPKDRETREPRGFTFCQYRRREDAEDAVKGMNKRVGCYVHSNLLLCICVWYVMVYVPTCPFDTSSFNNMCHVLLMLLGISQCTASLKSCFVLRREKETSPFYERDHPFQGHSLIPNQCYQAIQHNLFHLVGDHPFLTDHFLKGYHIRNREGCGGFHIRVTKNSV